VKKTASTYGLSLQQTLVNGGITKFPINYFKRSRSCSKENGKITIESLPPGLVTNKIMQADMTSEGTNVSEEASADKTSSEATVKNANPSSEGELLTTLHRYVIIRSGINRLCSVL
jgi:hypothetical protein